MHHLSLPFKKISMCKGELIYETVYNIYLPLGKLLGQSSALHNQLWNPSHNVNLLHARKTYMKTVIQAKIKQKMKQDYIGPREKLYCISILNVTTK